MQNVCCEETVLRTRPSKYAYILIFLPYWSPLKFGKKHSAGPYNLVSIKGKKYKIIPQVLSTGSQQLVQSDTELQILPWIAPYYGI